MDPTVRMEDLGLVEERMVVAAPELVANAHLQAAHARLDAGQVREDCARQAS